MPRAIVAILSVGQMGLGIGKLLQLYGYHVITNTSDRSASTQERAESANIESLDSDEEVVVHADYILSIVPPRDAVATAKRISSAFAKAQAEREQSKKEALYYIDLNAVAPSTAEIIAQGLSATTPKIKFVDGAIIGDPPTATYHPGIPLSGPHRLDAAPVSGAHLAQTLNARHLSDEVGKASGLKCCFAALTKGFTALSLQSFSTASALGVLPHLQHYLDGYSPEVRARAEQGIEACLSKASRWVEEMNHISSCFGEEGGFAGETAQVFRQIAGVFEGLADVVEKGGLNGKKGPEEIVKVLAEMEE